MVAKSFKISVKKLQVLFSSSAVEDEPHAFYMEPITAQEAATPPLVANTASAEVINLEIARY